MICTGRGKEIPPTAKYVTYATAQWNHISSTLLSPEGIYLFTITILAEVS
jgi:hypothetical protein